MGTVPTLPTTMPAARLASSTAVSGSGGRGETEGEDGDYRVAGTGDVKYLAGAGPGSNKAVAGDALRTRFPSRSALR